MTSGDGLVAGVSSRGRGGGEGDVNTKLQQRRQSRGAPAGGASLLRVESVTTLSYDNNIPKQLYPNFSLVQLNTSF